MLVQFLTDHELTSHGLSAKIHRVPINTICKDWLNIPSGYLTSQDHPTTYCSWVITAPIGSTISIQFHIFEVKINFSFHYCLTFKIIIMHFQDRGSIFNGL